MAGYCRNLKTIFNMTETETGLPSLNPGLNLHSLTALMASLSSPLSREYATVGSRGIVHPVNSIGVRRMWIAASF